MQEESELLLQQTAEAQGAEFSLKGVYDVEPWVRAAQDDRRLAAAQLSAILATLKVRCARALCLHGALPSAIEGIFQSGLPDTRAPDQAG